MQVQRVPLQEKIEALKAKHTEELQNLMSHMGQIISAKKEMHERENSAEALPEKFGDKAKGVDADAAARIRKNRLPTQYNKKEPDIGFDIEPEA